MTLQREVENDPKYKKVLDHGFVGLVDHMGNDNAIVQAARVSYGLGTKSVNEDRGLIRYLVRHKHTSPLEMCEVKLHIKLPIFVMRQLVRHRTSSLNEYSARYSVLTDEMYIPNIENIKPQSKTNKQGRAGDLVQSDAEAVQELIGKATNYSYRVYQTLLNEHEDVNEYFSEEFPAQGVARELARTVMPVAGYTELYWKQNLHNLFHMLKLRDDSHAQWEIQEFARAIYELVKPLFPIACEAYEDYIKNSATLSRMDQELLHEVISRSNELNVSFEQAYTGLRDQFESEKELAIKFGMSERELREFKEFIKF